MRLGYLAVALALVPACTCSGRPHVAVHGDGGPVVVVVERRADAGARGEGTGWRSLPLVELVDEIEPDDDLGHAQPLEYPKGMRGRLIGAASGRPDVDLYRWIPVGEGRLGARIELEGPADATLDVLDRSGAPVLRALPGEHVLPNLAVTAGEVWFLRVRGGRAALPSPSPPSSIDYRLVVRAAPLAPGDEAEPNDSAERANPLVPAVEETGYFGRPHDEDWLRLPAGLPAGGSVRLELSPVEGVVASLRVRDASGTLLVEARGARGEELRLRNAPGAEGGVVVVRAESGRNLAVPWRLRWAAEPALDGAEAEPNNTSSGANPLVLDAGGQATVAGFLWPGDVDLFRVRAAGPGLVEAVLESPPGVDARVEHASDSGAAIKAAAGADAGPRRLRALPVGGELLVRVSARPRDTAFDAPYTLTLSWRPALLPPGVATDEGSAPPEPR